MAYWFQGLPAAGALSDLPCVKHNMNAPEPSQVSLPSHPVEDLILPLRPGATDKRGANRIFAAAWPTDHRALVQLLMRRPDGGRATFAWLTRQTGMRHTSLWRIIHGYTRPTLDSALKICQALEISPWRLLEFSKRIRATPRPKGSQTKAWDKKVKHPNWKEILR